MSTLTPHVTVTAFREAVSTALAAELGVPVVAGRVDGATKQRHVACVWPMRRVRVSGNVLEEDITLGVRCWARWRDPKDADRPIDPTPLEELSETLLVALSAVQVSLGPWFIDVQSVTFDVEAQGIEATVVGRQWNPFAMCEEG